jgi:arginyl-tRNA synthetase
VVRDYYVNDDGEQVNKLALTVLLNYLNLFPESKIDQQFYLENGSVYQGESYQEVASLIKKK